MEWVWEDSRYSPPYTFSPGDPNPYSAADNGQNEGGGDQSRPRICYLEDYDFAVVCKPRIPASFIIAVWREFNTDCLMFTVAFHFGLSDGADGERNLPHFYPPFLFQDRLSNILVPILKSALRYPPTLVELGTGTWDLQHWTFEDRELDVDRMSPISDSRADWYSHRFKQALQSVEEAFPINQDSEETPPALVFREMQHTKMVDSVPPPRVHGLKNLQSHLLQDKLGEHGRWQIDPLGRLLLGQEHYYRGEYISRGEAGWTGMLTSLNSPSSNRINRLYSSNPTAGWKNLGGYHAA